VSNDGSCLIGSQSEQVALASLVGPIREPTYRWAYTPKRQRLPLVFPRLVFALGRVFFVDFAIDLREPSAYFNAKLRSARC